MSEKQVTSGRLGNGLGDNLGLSIRPNRQEVIRDVVLKQGAKVSDRDRAILREQAKKLAEVAARPIEEEKRKLWYKHNALEGDRPMVICDLENGWYEVITPDMLQCEGDLARVLEFFIRKQIWWGTELNDDTVIPNIIRACLLYDETPRGLDVQLVGESGEGGSFNWITAFNDVDDPYEAVKSLKPKSYHIYEKESQEYYELMQELFGDILDVRQETVWWHSGGMTYDLMTMLGMTEMLCSFLEDPDLIHAIMAFLRDEMLAKMDYAEKSGLLCLNNNDMYVGSGGWGWSHELPAPDYKGPVRLKDLWGFAESQETVGASPKHFGEFILPYQLPILEKFGLNCYACCEPVDVRWDYVKKIPNLRRVSVSKWANVNRSAEMMGNGYVFSYKPDSTWLAYPEFNEDLVMNSERGLRQVVKAAGRCNLELIMKDNHTIRHDPKRAVRFVELCRQAIAEMD